MGGPRPYPIEEATSKKPCVYKMSYIIEEQTYILYIYIYIYIYTKVSECSHTVAVATRLGNNCANKVKADVWYMAQPAPSASRKRMADVMNTQPDGMSIRNLHM